MASFWRLDAVPRRGQQSLTFYKQINIVLTGPWPVLPYRVNKQGSFHAYVVTKGVVGVFFACL